MKRADIHQGRCIKKLFPVTFDQISAAIVRTAVVSFLFIGMIFILTTGLSQARDADKVRGSNSTTFPSASLKTIIVKDYYPYTFVNDKGIPDGFSVDIAKAVASVMGLKLEISVDTWANAIKALGNGTIDMLPMMAASPERDKVFDFSVPHTIAYDAVFARKGVPRVRSLADLVDKTVIVLNKDAAHDYLLSSGMAARMKLILVDSLPDAFRTLAAGKGDAALMPKLVGLIVVKKLNLTNLDPSPVVIDSYNRPFCFAVKQGDQLLLERLSQGLSIIKATGQYQEIYKKWFGALEPPGLSRITVIKYIAGIVAVSLLIGLGLIIWNVSLRNQVALRTEKLETEIQERLKTEVILRESEEQYRNLFENAAEAIFVAQEGKLVFLNPMAAMMTGYSGEELMARPFTEFIHPDDRDMVIDRHVRRMKGEELPHIYSFRIIHKDGNIRWVELNAVLINWKGKASTLNFLSNITERKLAEEALKISEEEYRSLIENQTELVCRFNPDGTFIFVNDMYCHFYGKTKDELIGKKWFPLPIDDDFRYIQGKLLTLSPTNPIVIIENRLLSSKGDIHWIQFVNRGFFDLHGNLLEIQSVGRDITERKRAEDALRESEQMLRNLADNLPNAMIYQLTAEPDGGRRFTYVSRAVERLNETAEEEVLADAGVLYGQVLPEYRTVVREREEEALKNLTTMQVEVQSRLPSGRLCWFEYTSTPRHQADGLLVWDGVEVDITDRKKMEEELIKAQKLESVGILAGGIAHDFNNILTSIIGNISMAKMQVKPGQKIFYMLSAAETASMRAQGLTRQLLTFAKGGVPVKETASIQKLIKESTLFVLQGSKSVCEFQMAEDIWPVEADVGQISQVIGNIVINANQAMPEGGIIRITAENMMPEKIHEIPVKPGRYVRISIKDQGIGIVEKHLSKIFDPYFTTKQAGSGLGLATAYSIIKKHNGHISVDSLPGAGTTFHIYLPASDKEVPVKEEAVLLTGRGKILVMDDDKLLREMVYDMLEMLGYEAEFAENGDEAIEMYKKAMEFEKPYDAAILDLTIPGGMGGKEAIKILLNMDPEVKAIVYSGYSDGEVMSNFREYGFKGMMPKPFDTYALGKALNDVLKD